MTQVLSHKSAFDVPEGFMEVRGPELFKFESKGQELRGVFSHAEYFTMIDEVTNAPKQVLEVYLRNGRGLVKFRPSFDVRTKLDKSMRGKELLIRYIGDDESKGKNGNAYKVFGVYVKTLSQSADDPGIGDDDIPF